MDGWAREHHRRIPAGCLLRQGGSYTNTYGYGDGRTYRYSHSHSSTDANPNTIDDACFGQHLRHCHLLFESDPSPCARCDDDSHWYFVGLNLN